MNSYMYQYDSDVTQWICIFNAIDGGIYVRGRNKESWARGESAMSEKESNSADNTLTQQYYVEPGHQQSQSAGYRVGDAKCCTGIANIAGVFLFSGIKCSWGSDEYAGWQAILSGWREANLWERKPTATISFNRYSEDVDFISQIATHWTHLSVEMKLTSLFTNLFRRTSCTF